MRVDATAATSVIRPVGADDLDALVELVDETSFGLTTLPRDRELLARRIEESLRAFERLDAKPRGEAYLFVLESPSGRLLGTAGVLSKVGGFEPFYAYRIETSVHRSEMLGVRKEIQVLHLVREHDGPCEIGSLFLAPDARGRGTGRFLSLSRFLFMAEWPRLFDPIVIAEMRGVIDAQGTCPFWQAIGRHFFDLDFPTADYLSIVDKHFIAELMPSHPIYVPLLPESVRAVIGRVHEKTAPALRLLENEGFGMAGMIDIFDGGPVVRCPLAQIRTVRESRRAPVVAVDADPDDPTPYLVANTQVEWRAALGTLVETGSGVAIDAGLARRLGANPGDAVRYAELYSTPAPQRAPSHGVGSEGERG